MNLVRIFNLPNSARLFRRLLLFSSIVLLSQITGYAQYCTPTVEYLSKDIAIYQVTLFENFWNRDTLINNGSVESKYSDYTKTHDTATLYFGGSYTLQMMRFLTANDANRKAWIDFNRDGYFDDANELVLNESPGKQISVQDSFKVPSVVGLTQGYCRLRLSITYKTDPNVPCGSKSGIKNANRVGEFEDYMVELKVDNDTPSLFMNGSDTVCMEKNSIYTDMGAFALDKTAGDITSSITVTSDVDPSSIGIYYVVYKVKDPSGHEADSLTRVVYVVPDRTPPVITLTGDSVIYMEVDTGKYNEPGYKALDNNDGDITRAVQVQGTVNTDSLGEYTLVYEVRDASVSPCGPNITRVKRKVIVRDRTPPKITNKTIVHINKVEVELQSKFIDHTVFTDNYKPDSLFTQVTPGNCCSAHVDPRVKGRQTVRYYARDLSGNETVLYIHYMVEDYTAPVIHLNTPDTVYHEVNTPYKPVKPTVTDNIYDTTQISLTRQGSIDPFHLGLYQETYTATDASGNVAVKRRYVRVVDRTKPVIKGKYRDKLCVGLESTVNLLDSIWATDNYDPQRDVQNKIELIFTDLNTYVEGFYVATFRTEDAAGNVSDIFRLYIEVSKRCKKVNASKTVDIQHITLYPNPAQTLINIKVPGQNMSQLEIQLYDCQGREVTLSEDAKTKLDGHIRMVVGHLPRGLYFVRINAVGFSHTKSVLLN